MGLIAEIASDFDFRQPRVIVTDRTASIENVKKIITLTETSVTKCKKNHNSDRDLRDCIYRQKICHRQRRGF